MRKHAHIEKNSKNYTVLFLVNNLITHRAHVASLKLAKELAESFCGIGRIGYAPNVSREACELFIRR